jgi:uncharacterized protein (DUF433 family)
MGRVASITGMQTRSVIKIDPEIMSDTPCFVGTRGPARTLMDDLEGGDSLAASLETRGPARDTQAQVEF